MLVNMALKQADGAKRDETPTHFAHGIELLNAAAKFRSTLAGVEDYLPKADIGCAGLRLTSC